MDFATAVLFVSPNHFVGARPSNPATNQQNSRGPLL